MPACDFFELLHSCHDMVWTCLSELLRSDGCLEEGIGSVSHSSGERLVGIESIISEMDTHFIRWVYLFDFVWRDLVNILDAR